MLLLLLKMRGVVFIIKNRPCTAVTHHWRLQTKSLESYDDKNFFLQVCDATPPSRDPVPRALTSPLAAAVTLHSVPATPGRGCRSHCDFHFFTVN